MDPNVTDKLSKITHLIIDMDGVLYLGDQPMPRLREFFAFLRERPIPFILATNNSTRTPQEYVDKLAGMGVTVSPDEILVSGQATARFLAREYPRGTRVHVFGMPALKQAMTDEGFVLADEDVQLVVASMDREVTYEKLKRATLLIRGGARFIATNLDPTNPSEEGLIPGTGSMIVALETASGVKPQPSASRSRPCTNWRWNRWVPAPKRQLPSVTASIRIFSAGKEPVSPPSVFYPVPRIVPRRKPLKQI